MVSLTAKIAAKLTDEAERTAKAKRKRSDEEYNARKAAHQKEIETRVGPRVSKVLGRILKDIENKAKRGITSIDYRIAFFDEELEESDPRYEEHMVLTVLLVQQLKDRGFSAESYVHNGGTSHDYEFGSYKEYSCEFEVTVKW